MSTRVRSGKESLDGRHFHTMEDVVVRGREDVEQKEPDKAEIGEADIVEKSPLYLHMAALTLTSRAVLASPGYRKC